MARIRRLFGQDRARFAGHRVTKNTCTLFDTRLTSGRVKFASQTQCPHRLLRGETTFVAPLPAPRHFRSKIQY
ncbi:hypothetical protein RR46_14376 [Papilio xuthus]|uniref:Uncharacterized protein n=1 Tax=Papilio xuthus TaxID=66420 RepID=A0A194PPU7_PAPXU|nr:hypothetical protein RR46_14376 [Papilio xuthus]